MWQPANFEHCSQKLENPALICTIDAALQKVLPWFLRPVEDVEEPEETSVEEERRGRTALPQAEEGSRLWRKTLKGNISEWLV